MKINYRNELFRQLRDELVDATPTQARIAHATRAEELLSDLDSGNDLPYDFYHFRITQTLPKQGSNAQISTADARHDMRMLVEDVWDSANVPVEAEGERVLTIDDLAKLFNVSGKTISRWRERGLVGRRYVIDGRKRLGFPQSAVDRFVSRNQDRVARGSRFRHLSDRERDEIIALARSLVADGGSQKRVIEQVAARTGRSVETIRYTIKGFDEQHPGDAVFRSSKGLLSESTRRRIFSQYHRGVSVSTLAKRHGTTPAAIKRAIRDLRLERIFELPLDFIPNDEFELRDADNKILTPTPKAEYKPRKARRPSDLPAYLASLYEVPLLTKDQEQHLFRKFNFLKFRAAQLRETLDESKPRTELMTEIEKLYNEAVSVKNQLIQANLRLVVSVAKKYVSHSGTLFDLISDGNMSLIKAVEKFDYGLGYKFSTYATWAIKKNFARTFSTQLRHQDRFRTSQDELLTAQAEYRANPRRRESVQSEYEQAVSNILGDLDDREREIITSRYGLKVGTEPQTLKAVGEQFGVSKERIRQLEARAIAKLRASAKDQGVDLVEE